MTYSLIQIWKAMIPAAVGCGIIGMTYHISDQTGKNRKYLRKRVEF